MCGAHHCLWRGTSAPDSEILSSALGLGQGCARFSPGSANRCGQVTCHPRRTSSPLRPSLSFWYTQGPGDQLCLHAGACSFGVRVDRPGSLWLGKGRGHAYEAALEFAARALVVDPNSADAYVALVYTRLFQRRHDDASAAGEEAIAPCPNGAGFYHMAAMFHGYAGDFRKAAEYEKQAQRLSPLSRNESTVDRSEEHTS